MSESTQPPAVPRYQVPDDVPDEVPDAYQARLARAQRAYQLDQGSAWDTDAARPESEQDDQVWTAPQAAQPLKRGPFGWLRRRGVPAEPELEQSVPVAPASPEPDEPDTPVPADPTTAEPEPAPATRSAEADVEQQTGGELGSVARRAAPIDQE